MDISTRRSIDAALQRTDLALGPVPRSAFELFVRVFLKRADERYLQERTPESLLAELAATLRFVYERPGDEIKVRVFNPTVEGDGYTLDQTVIETCMRDQPFLLDTLRLLYRTRDIREHYCLHPIIDLHRSPEGRLDRIGAPRDGEEEGWKESCMHFEIERIESADEREALRAEILDRLHASQAVVRDFTRMLHRVSVATHDLLLLGGQQADRRNEAEEAAAFLRWLMEDNFIFMGYEEFEATRTDAGVSISPRDGERLGLRLKVGDAPVEHPFPEIALDWAQGESLVFCGKDELESKVHRSGKIDTILIRQLDAEGRLQGFRLLSGLFTYKGISQDGDNIPILRERLEAVLHREEAVPGSHLYKAIITGFNSIPVEYLFGTDVDGIWEAIQLILSAENRNDTAFSVRIEPNRRSAFVLSSMPKRHYDEELREEISQYLIDTLGATYLDHRLVLGELDNVVLQLYLTAPGGLKEVDVEALEARILQLARPWAERFRGTLETQFGEERAELLAEQYAEAFPEQYTLVTTPEEAVRDVQSLETLRSSGQMQVRLSRDGEEPGSAIVRLKIYDRANIDLTDSLPVLDNFGLRVVDQSATRLPLDHQPAWLDVFRVSGVKGRTDVDLFAREHVLADALRAVYSKQVDDDLLNRLVLSAGLNYRQVDALRAYIAYVRQQENVPLDFIRRVWLNHPKAARLLLELFEVRFDPALEPGFDGAGRLALVQQRREAFVAYLKGVESAAEDRVLRAVSRLVDGTLRTNFFRTPTRAYISFKFDADAIHGTTTGLRPFREIFVHHNAVEGVHLRGGPIARGGLRWSDRLDDYRTEILDLMRTQMTKNTIIVPVGAKGGFILKKQYPSREIERAQADEMYKIFIRGLLDVTDNIVDGKVVHPPGVLAYDGDDPYLVVAADKGTAHLSDTANAISIEYGFWLGDAFASGGSKGYDHKKEAITAKGAWECVKRHFREIGVNPETDVITVSGVGDMSGDVFGNGMLLSRTMKLQAAFNHMHIFLDPDPDPARSFEERSRLFHLPRSTWEDYNREVMSAGSGIFRRTAKAIPLTPQMQALLGTEEATLSGEQVVRLILKMPVDLLWNGGIGTYVKASNETHADVGDRVNDGVRIDGLELRAKIVGEGGNLGFTQAGRIEYARCGGRLNTDATDNSGGVDMSDHEVNLKILFQPMLRSGAMTQGDRDDLLVRMTGDVAASVLSHNYNQSLMISLDESRSRDNLSRFVSVIDDLEQSMGFNRAQERLPNVEKLQARMNKGEGLYRPELAKLGAYMKMRVKNWLTKEPRMQGPFVEQLLASYFPAEVRSRFLEQIRQHPLRQQIINTVVTSKIVDFAGISFFQEIYEDTGHTAPEIAMAYLVSAEILGADHLKRALFEQDNHIPAAGQYRALIDMEDALAAQSRRLLRRGYDVFQPQDLIARLQDDFKDLHLVLPDVLPARAAEQLEADFREYRELGIPEPLARRVASFPYLASGGEIAMLHEEGGLELTVAAWLYHAVGEDTRVRAAFELALGEPGANRWEKSAMAVLRGKLIDLQYRMALQVALDGPRDESVETKLARYLEARGPIIARIRALEQRVAGGKARGVAPVTVLTEVIQELVR